MTDTPRSTSSNLPLYLAGIALIGVYVAVIALLNPRLAAIELLADRGASWYLWKLPEPTFWTRLAAWGFYTVHQVGFWVLILLAQRQKLGYSGSLHRLNILALGWNGAFVLLHLVQTHIWYDGLAQDVSIWSSMGSVVVLLIWVLLMEQDRRGLFFGKAVPTPRGVMEVAKKYHGYYFSWAIVYTFWYHPTVSTPGHLVGFFYLLLIMFQGSLFFTRAHVNRRWTLLLELGVVAHATMVAIYQPYGLWAMFLFGFLAIFVITQMHGTGLPKLWRWIIGLTWLAVTVIYYARLPIERMNEPLRIPIIDYVGVFVLIGLLWLGSKMLPGIKTRE